MIDPQLSMDKTPDQSKGTESGMASDTPVTPAPINPDDLHDLFVVAPTGELSDEEDPFAQMRNDPNYAALMRDLEAIATAAKQMFAEQNDSPSDELWGKISQHLTDNPGEPES